MVFNGDVQLAALLILFFNKKLTLDDVLSQMDPRNSNETLDKIVISNVNRFFFFMFGKLFQSLSNHSLSLSRDYRYPISKYAHHMCIRAIETTVVELGFKTTMYICIYNGVNVKNKVSIY